MLPVREADGPPSPEAKGMSTGQAERGATAKGRFRMLLNTSYSSPQAWLLLAHDRGYLDEAGIALDLTTGAGAYPAASRMAAEGFDLGYGDINALVELAAAGTADTPVGVLMLFDASPSVIAVKAGGPIHRPADLAGRTIIGHDTDVALRTFGAFCLKAGVDAATVTIETPEGGLSALVGAMQASDRIDGVFGYASTIRAALAAEGVDADTALRFVNYADHAPELYGSCVMASRRMIHDHPDALAACLHAFRRGLRDMLADPDAAIDAVARRRPDMSRAAEMLRLRTTLAVEMASASPARLPGRVDEARLARAIELLVRGQGLAATPAPNTIFSNRFLPS